MILTLYRNCILNDKYYEVFDTKKRGNNDKSAFVTYLESLDNTVIEVENVYVKYYGNILLPYDVATGITALDYNYMKVENEEQTIYAFINSIELVNQVVNLTYAQDVWANWSDKCTIRQGLLNACSDKTNRLYYLPNDIVSNEPIKWGKQPYPLTTDFLETVQVIVILQQHTLVQGSENEDRTQRVFVASFGTTGSILSPSQVSGVLDTILSHENEKILKPLGNSISGEQLFYYDLVSFYVVPRFSTKTPVLPSTGDFDWELEGTVISFYELEDNEYYLEERTFEDSASFSQNQINTYTRSIGIFGHQIDFMKNGYDVTLELKLRCYEKLVNIYLTGPETYDDVTQLFEIEPYYVSASDSSIVQRKTNYWLQKNTLTLSNVRKSVGYGFDMAGNVADFLTSKDLGEKGGAIGSAIGGTANFVFDMIENSYKMNAITAEMHGNFTASKSSVKNDPILNATIGLNQFYITPVNEELVNDYIKILGYKVIEFIENGDISLYNENLDNCVLKYGFVNVSGSAPQNILRAIEDILMKTTKIYYNGTIS